MFVHPTAQMTHPPFIPASYLVTTRGRAVGVFHGDEDVYSCILLNVNLGYILVKDTLGGQWTMKIYFRSILSYMPFLLRVVTICSCALKFHYSYCKALKFYSSAERILQERETLGSRALQVMEGLV